MVLGRKESLATGMLSISFFSEQDAMAERRRNNFVPRKAHRPALVVWEGYDPWGFAEDCSDREVTGPQWKISTGGVKDIYWTLTRTPRQ